MWDNDYEIEHFQTSQLSKGNHQNNPMIEECCLQSSFG
ncbi:hypothetical protein PsAD14_01304 [Pseudovibrio sp. Ad14]|nr:hypothetical protein PsW74_05486 [Pseudovibrio sp. W74]KZL10397.1 hypothetical protein PsAD14_01304 [Pseudovibrio sp. Ad14]